MKNQLISILYVASLGGLLAGCGGSSGGGGTRTAKFTQTNLIADTSGQAAHTDPDLVNAWGISYSPGGPFWISDNGSGFTTVYDGTGAAQLAPITIPAAGGGNNGPVTGQVYNGTGGFAIGNTGTAVFIFDSEDGLISAWNGGSSATVVSDQSATGAVYKGLALAANNGNSFLYATNFNSGMVDVFDTTFTKTTSFTDVNIPSGFAPFGIVNIGGLLYVSFAKQNPAKHDDVAGAGNGYIDVFQPNGTLSKRLVSQGNLNSPWGLVQAPASFGNVGNALLVGNFGDGHINAYNIGTGSLVASFQNAGGQPLVIPGLWGLIFGNGGSGGSASDLYFTAGPGGESHGLFGSLAPSP